MLLSDEREMGDMLNLVEPGVRRHRRNLHENARRRGNDQERVKNEPSIHAGRL